MICKRLTALLLTGAFAVGTAALAQSAQHIRNDQRDIQKDRIHRDKEVREARRAYRRGRTRKGNKEVADARKIQRHINRDKRDLRRDIRRREE